MRFELCSRKPTFFFSLDIRLLSKALKGEMIRFLLSFWFAMKPSNERAKRKSIFAQGVR